MARGRRPFCVFLAGETVPDSRDLIKPADDLHIVYFDQHRQKTARAISPCARLSRQMGILSTISGQIMLMDGVKRFLFSTRSSRYAFRKIIRRREGADLDCPSYAPAGRRLPAR